MRPIVQSVCGDESEAVGRYFFPLYRENPFGKLLLSEAPNGKGADQFADFFANPVAKNLVFRLATHKGVFLNTHRTLSARRAPHSPIIKPHLSERRLPRRVCRAALRIVNSPQ